MKQTGLEYSKQSESQMKGSVERLSFIYSRKNNKCCVIECGESAEEPKEMMLESRAEAQLWKSFVCYVKDWELRI